MTRSAHNGGVAAAAIAVTALLLGSPGPTRAAAATPAPSDGPVASAEASLRLGASTLVNAAESGDGPGDGFVVTVSDGESLRVLTAADAAGAERIVVDAWNDGQAVLDVAEDGVVKAFDTPNDPYGSYQSQYEDLHLAQVWPTTTGAGTVVAVLDTGVDTTHPDLAGQILPGMEFVSSEGSSGGLAGCTTDHSPAAHGTHVTGSIVALLDNSQYVYGVAPGAKVLPVCVLDSNGSGTFSDVSRGIIWAVDHGADIINMSLGADGNGTYTVLDTALDYAASHDVLVVVAAGNNGAVVPVEGNYPASDDRTLAVGAVTSHTLTRASFSNHAPGLVDLVAPGVSQGSTSPSWSTGPGVALKSGTSMATPNVAAVAALLRSALPNATAQQIRALLETTAQDLGASGRDDDYGWGLARPDLALAEAGSGDLPVVEPADPFPDGLSGLTMVPAYRAADTRQSGTVPAGAALQVYLGGPAGAVAAVTNITAVAGDDGGFLTAYSPSADGTCRLGDVPDTSTVNVTPHDVRAATAIVNLRNSTLCVYASMRTDVLVDISGFLVPGEGAGYTPLSPARLWDTRGAVRPGGEQVITVSLGITSTAVALNLTAVGPVADTYLTIWPAQHGCTAATRPEVSAVNVSTGGVRPNSVIVDGSAGAVCVYASVPTDVIVDLSGRFDVDTGAGFEPVTAQRVFDSRAGSSVTAARELRIAAAAASTAGVVAVEANVTAVGRAEAGYVTAYPCGSPLPEVSNVNFAP
ncbi:MAG: S8 family serine peptidase, partial [Ilumatobacteraceae bacterium]